MSDEQVMQDVEEFYSQQGGTFYSYFLEFDIYDYLKAKTLKYLRIFCKKYLY